MAKRNVELAKLQAELKQKDTEIASLKAEAEAQLADLKSCRCGQDTNETESS